ncbi:hypothetical protein AAFC00_000814 [Neodothiora populina]
MAERSNVNPRHIVQNYVRDTEKLLHLGDWRSFPEVPTAEELAKQATTAQSDHGTPSSKEEYLKEQYLFCREEASFAIRGALYAVRHAPQANEPELRISSKKIGVYDNAHVLGVIFSPAKGFCTRLSFSTNRTQVSIDWVNSPRLKTGSLIIASASSDNFKKHLLPGIIAARQTSLLNKKPPEIDIVFPHDVVFDPTIKYTIIEETQSYFESFRHTMLALQQMTLENLPLAGYLVDPATHNIVGNPPHIVSNPELDLSHVIGGPLTNFEPPSSCVPSVVNLMSDWPKEHPPRSLDQSQMEALKQMLTKEMALVQGPPGTGKTHTSVAALQALCQGMKRGDPPIVVVSKTNHALDQLLLLVNRHVTPHFVRLGAQSTDETGIIERQGLQKMRESLDLRSQSRTFRQAQRELQGLETTIRDFFEPLKPFAGFFDHQVFLKYGIITPAQFDAIEREHKEYENLPSSSRTPPPVGPTTSWLRNDMPLFEAITPALLMFPMRETELEDDFLDDFIDENAAETLKKQRMEVLSGSTMFLKQNWVGSNWTANASATNIDNIAARVRKLDMARANHGARGSAYNLMLAICKEVIAAKVAPAIAQYNRLAKLRGFGHFEPNVAILKRHKIVGMTATGLGKYRAMIAAAGVKVVMIEEAAEALECTLVPALMPTVEHVIQVGDHKQLPPHVNSPAYANTGFVISLFERLILAGVEMRMLQHQRRMRPEISRLLDPIYGGDLLDHECVGNRPAVPGVAHNSFFADHDFQEKKNAQWSTLNEDEAAYIVEFAVHLIRNGVAPASITILTFYNGQRICLKSRLRKHKAFAGNDQPRVSTVDSYQGQENDVVILSLARSASVGFIANPNRVNVALSRARNGLYVFGNSTLLARDGGHLWKDLLEILEGADSSIVDPSSGGQSCLSRGLPLLCGCGAEKTLMFSAKDIVEKPHGCKRVCNAKLSCGHNCGRNCHESPHDSMSCQKSCQRVLVCGHACISRCNELCKCSECQPHLAPSSEVREVRSAAASASVTGMPRRRLTVPSLNLVPHDDDVEGDKITASGKLDLVEEMLAFDMSEVSLVDLDQDALSHVPVNMMDDEVSDQFSYDTLSPT